MRLAVIADIHSNLPALEAVLDDIRRMDIDNIIVAGDSINGGPFPAEVLDCLHGMNLLVLMGNHEQYILDCHNPKGNGLYENGRWGSVHWTVEQLSDEQLDYVRALPMFTEWNGVLINHGSPDNLFGGIQPSAPDKLIEERFGSVRQQWVITAHTHMPWVRQWRHLTLINPGSVGMPLDDNPAASYVILTRTSDGLLIQHRRVVYNTKLVEQASIERGLLESGGKIAQILLQETMTGKHLLIDFLHRVQKLIDEQGLSDVEAIELTPIENKTTAP
jgi:putative phosphoesterase